MICLLNSKKVFLGSTDKTAFAVLKIQTRKSRPKDGKIVPGPVPQSKTFMCKHCGYVSLDRDDVVVHKMNIHGIMSEIKTKSNEF